LGCQAEKGLSDNLLENEPLEKLIINPGVERMTILPAGQPRRDSTRLLGSRKMIGVIEELKNRYNDRYVLFDSPALLTLPDSVAFSSLVDGVVLVVEKGKTPKDRIRKALELLQGRRIIGFVLNRMNSNRKNGSTKGR
jgi:Mrp family chromosome partitioning ATPase